MIKHSQQSKGYLPIKSGPNMMGFDMGKSGSLMEMMQTGGQTSRGAAILARSRQRRADIRKLEEQQRAEAKRQKRGGLFGSIGGIGGGLLASLALGALGLGTGGLGLGLAAGLGTALGRRAGEGIGAGKTRKVDTEGTVYGQQSFRDLEQASRDYTRGMGERAIVSGLKSGLMAGFTPGGGIFGKVRDAGGKLRAAQLAKSVPIADTGLLNMAELKTPGIDMRSPVFDPSTGSRTGDVIFQSRRVFDPSTGAGIGALPDMQFTTEGALSGVESGLSRGLSPDIPSSLGDSDLLSGYFGSLSQGQSPVFAGPSLASGGFFSGMEDGGLIEYQNGGSVNIQQILQNAGVTATPDQLALFEKFDPSTVNNLASSLQDSLISGTQKIQQQQSGTGFAGSGVTQQAQAQQREDAMGQLESEQEQAARDFESQTLADLARFEEQEVEFDTYTAPPPTVSSLPTSDQGNVMFQGDIYVWDTATGSYIIRPKVTSTFGGS
jgi:hypothetical protein